MKWAVDKEEHQYFDRELLRGYSFEDGFVDAGAYVGDTVDSFFRHFRGGTGIMIVLRRRRIYFMN